jgi:biotin carboxylase
VARLALVIPTASYRAAELLEAAERLGVEVLIASERTQAFAARRPDNFLRVDLADPEAAGGAIAAAGAAGSLTGVVSVDDEGLLAAAHAAQRLGLRHSDPEAVAVTRDKVAMRRLLDAAHVPQPEFAVVAPAPGLASGEDADALADEVAATGARLGYPVVVKPPTLSASRGVIRADDDDGARRAASRALSVLRDAGKPASTPLLVESFVAGEEIALEGLLRNGQLDVLAIFDKPERLDGPYFEETIYVTPSRHPGDVQAHAAEVIAAACRAIGLRNGPVHAELRLPEHDGEAVVIEVAARTIGGRCAKALRFATGASLDELVLANALGWDDGPRPDLEPGAAGVLMIPIPASGRLAGVDHVEDVRAMPGVAGVELTIPRGAAVRALPEGDRYLGFVFARAARPSEVEAVLRRARDRLAVRIDPLDETELAAHAAALGCAG